MAEKKSKYPGKPGRPSEYKPEYCDLLVTHFKKGKSYTAFAALCDVDRDTLYEWETKHPEFSDAKKRGWAHYQTWWEDQGQDGIYNQTFKEEGGGTRTISLNSAVWIYNMKCRFRKDWHDAQKIEADIKTTTDESEEVKELVAWLKRVREIE